jgi:hypothetical protein
MAVEADGDCRRTRGAPRKWADHLKVDWWKDRGKATRLGMAASGQLSETILA